MGEAANLHTFISIWEVICGWWFDGIICTTPISEVFKKNAIDHCRVSKQCASSHIITVEVSTSVYQVLIRNLFSFLRFCYDALTILKWIKFSWQLFLPKLGFLVKSKTLEFTCLNICGKNSSGILIFSSKFQHKSSPFLSEHIQLQIIQANA
jgi:hypothetical protein